MKRTRHIRHHLADSKIGVLFILVGVASAMLWFVPPTTFLIQLAGVLLIAICVLLILTYFFSLRTTAILSLFFVLFLTLNTLVGFDLINTLLLFSFIMAVSRLIPR